MSSRELVKVATLSMCLGVVYSKSQNKKLLTSNTLSLPIKGLLFVSFFCFSFVLVYKAFFLLHKPANAHKTAEEP